MQRSCLELEKTRRAEGTRVQKSCLDLRDKKSIWNKNADNLLRVRREKKS